VIILSDVIVGWGTVFCDIQNIQGGDNAYQDLHYSGYYWESHPIIILLLLLYWTGIIAILLLMSQVQIINL